MPCFSPLKGWRGAPTAAGPAGIVFSRKESTGMHMQVPCGGCLGCRLERSREWGVRCVHEAKMHEKNCFITLTYDEEHLPPNGGLDRRGFPGFIRSLRQKLQRECVKASSACKKIRYFHAGEYGTLTRRPHYHALIFGYDFPDKVKTVERKGNVVFSSEELEDVWAKGMCEIGTLTLGSAQYVAKYILAKNSGPMVEGEAVREFATMSSRPGIGKTWYDKWKDDVYPSDQIVIEGKVSKPPAYYDLLLERENPKMFAAVKAARTEKRRKEDETEERLMDIEVCTRARINLKAERGL